MANPLEGILGRFGSFNVTGTLISLSYGVGIVLLILGIGWVVYNSYKNKKTYIFPIRLIRYLQNGSKKEINNLRGGEITFNGIKDFEVKMGMKKQRLGYIPDYSLMDADSRLVFITIGDGKTWQQVKEELKLEKEIEVDGENGEEKSKLVYRLLAEPIPTEVKTSTLNSLRNWREILDKKRMTAWAIGLGMFIIMVIAHLVSLYIQTRVKCPAP